MTWGQIRTDVAMKTRVVRGEGLMAQYSDVEEAFRHLEKSLMKMYRPPGGWQDDDVPSLDCAMLLSQWNKAVRHILEREIALELMIHIRMISAAAGIWILGARQLTSQQQVQLPTP